MAGFIDPLDKKNAIPNATFDPQDIQDNRVVSALAYWWILFFLPLVACPQSRYGRFHANQGLVLFIASILCGVLAIIPFIGFFLTLIGSITCFVWQILGTVNALQGNGKRLPLIGEIEIIK